MKMKIGFIGMGNMAQALCEGFINTCNIPGTDILAYAPHRDKLENNAARIGFTPADSPVALAEASDMIFIACKPYQIEQVLGEIGEALSGKALVSVAAGWDYNRFSYLLASLSVSLRAETDSEEDAEEPEALIDTVRVQCIMPNTPAMVGEGVFLVEQENSLTPEEREALLFLLSALGLVHELPSSLMGIGGALTGCSPAFVDLMLEAYADAAVKYGIPRADAYRLISQAVSGSAKLALATGEHPGVLKDRVCSPAGTTICGVQALEKNGFRAACMASIDAIMEKKKS